MRLTLIFLLFVTQSYSQIRIDEIKNDTDVIKYVFEYGKKHQLGWKEVSFNFYSEWLKQELTKEDKLFYDSLTRVKWIKSDFNNDGRTDLIFSGRVYNQLAVLAFISGVNDSTIYHSLGHIFYDRPSGISEYKTDNLNLLLIRSYRRNNSESWGVENYKLDTLVYKLGGFIEYNNMPGRKMEFDSIIYRTLNVWSGLNDIPVVKIFKEGRAFLYSGSYFSGNEPTWGVNNRTEFKVISPERISYLQNLLACIDFIKLEDNYALKFVTDLTTATTEVYYNGKVKKIKDYGCQGTYGLSLLYQSLNSIKAENRFRKE